ncbi:B3 domain-containing protein REM10-like isoform X2 [Lycium ferocissimum]|uniref:B3 domain-containing protein REM10-like isoform X2 n=1 Tax=Lycium ferocissimum TaxID=112874 RepID=UPI0028155424|nr:B3 domain-containing protein REM10-like isoform X2 [Lycium ferocissimum]
MKIPSKKPHFFKPIQPGFKNGLKIPIGFFKYLKGHDQHGHAILRRAGKKWPVKVNGHRLEEGNWKEFVEEYDLQLGDILVFRHEGNMEFDVSIFDSTHCDREYARCMQMEEKEDHTVQETSKKFEFKAITDLRLKTSDVTTPKSQIAASTSADANPHFISTIKPYTIKNPVLYLPMDFVKSSGLMNKSEMILVDEKQRSWSMWLGRTERHFGIKRGWRQFSKANGVQVGDTYKFELTINGTIPVAHFHYLRLKTSNVTTPKSQVAASTSADANPHFISTVKPYSMTKTDLYLPMDFVKSNGLMNRSEMILVDEKQRSWSVRLGRTERHFGIKRGWRQFIKANGVQVGDTYKFELTNNGTIPIVHFHYLRLKTSNVTTPNSQVAASTSADANPHLSHCNTEYAEYLQEEEEDEEVEEDEFDMEDEYEEEEDKEKGEEAATHNKPFGQSHFECTIRPYCLSKSFLCLPKPFVFANGLTNIKCGLVIRDERQRSWNLRIISSKSQVLIGDGWRKFIADNHLKEGDRIKFEVVTDGETPIWKFQVVTDAKTPLQKFQGQSHFECTIGRYCLSRNYLFLPQQFAIANGLINKNCWLIVRDKRKRSWKLKLSHSNKPRPRAYIGGGWCKFIAENCLKEGGRIMFEVVTNGETPIWKFHVVTNGETPMKKFQEKPSPSIKLSDETSSHAEAATNEPCVQSYFECTIRQYCLSRGLLYLPQQFAFANGLIDKNCDLIIRDERQRSWNLKLRYWEPLVYITDEWRKFIADNCLKEGDRIKFEVVTNGETPIWKFQVVSEAETPLQKFQDIMKKPSNVSPLDAQGSTSTSVDDDHPFFISTIKPYCISKTEFCLPTDFVKSNGLINRKCEMILQDEAQRCWSVWLGRIGNRFGITRGWTVFRAANGLQIGDAYKFELIKNGEVPIAHFHCRYSKKVAKRKKR